MGVHHFLTERGSETDTELVWKSAGASSGNRSGENIRNSVGNIVSGESQLRYFVFPPARLFVQLLNKIKYEYVSCVLVFIKLFYLFT